MKQKAKQPMAVVFKVVVIAVILAAGWIAIFNIPETIESFLPVVQTVTITPTEYNQTVSGAGLITHDVNSGNWFVTISVGENDIRRVKTGQSADISGAAFDDGIYTAIVYDIGSLAVQHQGEYSHETVVEVILKIDSNISGENGLRSGYTARADIKTDEARTINIIPYSAILQDDMGEFVFTLSGNTAVRRDILTGIELSAGAEVIAGLSPDDEVILYPESINENSLVNKTSNYE